MARVLKPSEELWTEDVWTPSPTQLTLPEALHPMKVFQHSEYIRSPSPTPLVLPQVQHSIETSSKQLPRPIWTLTTRATLTWDDGPKQPDPDASTIAPQGLRTTLRLKGSAARQGFDSVQSYDCIARLSNVMNLGFWLAGRMTMGTHVMTRRGYSAGTTVYFLRSTLCVPKQLV